MADNNRIVLEVGVQGDAEIRIKRITDAVTELGEKGSSSVGKFSSVWDIFAGNLAANAVGKAFGVAMDAAGKLFDVLITDGVKSAQETEDNIVRLNQAMAANGKYSAQATEELKAYADTIQKTTKFSDDQVLSTQALIATYGQLGAKELKVATQAALDLSTAYGINLEQATRMVGKAAAGEADAFSKLKIRFNEGSTAAETFANAMEAIRAKGLNGASAAQANTFSGALAITKHAFEDVTKEIGNVIIRNPALISLLQQSAQAFGGLSQWIVENKKTIQTWISGGINLAVGSLATFVNAIRVAADYYGLSSTALTNMSNRLNEMSEASKKSFAATLRGAEAATPAVKNFTGEIKNLTSAQDELIKKGVELAEKSDPTIKFIKEVQALQAANAAKRVDEETYIATVLELQARRDQAISDSLFKEAEGYIEKNRALLADDRSVNDALVNSNLDKLKRMAADEKLSAKDRGKIQSEITKTEKQQHDERVGAGMAALSALASFQQFKSKEMQAVGKAAAIANTTIATYEGATKAYASLAGIPFVGPALAAAAAGAIIAAGLANVAKISGVDLETGLERVPPGYPNDTFRANLSTDEGVLNRRDNRMLTVVARSNEQSFLMGEILNRLDRLESHTTVIVGQKTIVDEFRDAYESGRVINA